jgi:signal transduction histidine kinase
MITSLDDGLLLLVGRDLREQEAIRGLVLRGLSIGGLIALLLLAGGAVFFRHQIDGRIGEIRRAARDIEQGDISRRIPTAGDDEFEHLSRDINRMLDRIQQLMDGVRQVSNSIAHDLRTPLSRIRNRLDEVLQRQPSAEQLREAICETTEGIDELLVLFDKLLQIAEAESGMRMQFTEAVDLGVLATDMIELYDASAEQAGTSLRLSAAPGVTVLGDRDLLANAVASLLDNAIKYAGGGASVCVGIVTEAEHAIISVTDDGPGIATDELPKVNQRFYRLDSSRSKPGNGLGLAIVEAIAALHGGSLLLENAHPGLRASLRLPLHEKNAAVRATSTTFPNRNSDTSLRQNAAA